MHSPTWKIRSGVGIATAATSASSLVDSKFFSAASQLRPARPISSERRAFCRLSGKVRPMAIASPTLRIWVPSTLLAPSNFSNAQRGTLVTT